MDPRPPEKEIVAVKTYLINHLRIPGGAPNSEGLSYLDQVEATVAPYGGKWLAQGSGEVLEGAWPGSVVLMNSLTATPRPGGTIRPTIRRSCPFGRGTRFRTSS